jgi:hypothetical protein
LLPLRFEECARSQIIVSGDKHLLAKSDCGRVRVLTSRDFVQGFFLRLAKWYTAGKESRITADQNQTPLKEHRPKGLNPSPNLLPLTFILCPYSPLSFFFWLLYSVFYLYPLAFFL